MKTTNDEFREDGKKSNRRGDNLMGIALDYRHQFMLRECLVPCFLIVAIAAIAFVGCDDRSNGDPNSKPASDPKQMLKDKYDLIEIDMTEAQVDQILAGHPCAAEKFNRLEMEIYGSPDSGCKGTPLFRKWYDEKQNAIERDSYVEVYFDNNHKVFHKNLGEYIK
jgi:hypothetical protein